MTSSPAGWPPVVALTLARDTPTGVPARAIDARTTFAAGVPVGRVAMTRRASTQNSSVMRRTSEPSSSVKSAIASALGGFSTGTTVR